MLKLANVLVLLVLSKMVLHARSALPTVTPVQAQLAVTNVLATCNGMITATLVSVMKDNSNLELNARHALTIVSSVTVLQIVSLVNKV